MHLRGWHSTTDSIRDGRRAGRFLYAAVGGQADQLGYTGTHCGPAGPWPSAARTSLVAAIENNALESSEGVGPRQQCLRPLRSGTDGERRPAFNIRTAAERGRKQITGGQPVGGDLSLAERSRARCSGPSSKKHSGQWRCPRRHGGGVPFVESENESGIKCAYSERGVAQANTATLHWAFVACVVEL